MATLSEAFQNAMASNLDPMNGVMRQYAQQTTAQQELSLEDQRSELIEKIEQKLAAAVARNARPAVINAYEKMLARLDR